MNRAKEPGDGVDGGGAAGLRALLERARRGDPGALPGLRVALDADPSLWQEAGDLAARAEQAWVGLACGSHNLYAREALARRLAALKAELAGPRPSPVERLLVERIAACWLQAAFADAAAAGARDAGLKQAEFLARRQDAAQRRYLAAVRALTTYRTLTAAAARPAVAAPWAPSTPDRAAPRSARPTGSAAPGELRLVGEEGRDGEEIS
jgi:hypothetical protein